MIADILHGSSPKSDKKWIAACLPRLWNRFHPPFICLRHMYITKRDWKKLLFLFPNLHLLRKLARMHQFSSLSFFFLGLTLSLVFHTLFYLWFYFSIPFLLTLLHTFLCSPSRAPPTRTGTPQRMTPSPWRTWTFWVARRSCRQRRS